MQDNKEAKIIEFCLPYVLLWLAIVLLQIVASQLYSPVWQDGSLSLLNQLALLAKESLLSAISIFVFALFILLIKTMGALLPGTADGSFSPLLLRLQIAVKIISLFIFFLLLLSSWQLYTRLKIFIGIDSLLLLEQDTVQLFQHFTSMASGSVVVTLFVAFILALSVSVAMYAAGRLGFLLKKNIVFTSFLILFSLIVVSTVNSVKLANSQEVVYSQNLSGRGLVGYFQEIENEHVGPFLYFSHDVKSYLTPLLLVSGDLEFELDQKKIISMDQYLASVDASKINKPNVIIILVESMRRDVLSAYGGLEGVMPNVQALSEQGMVFENAYAQSSHSNYADLAPLSSQYPLRSRNTHYYPENPVYPRVLFYDILKALNYDTAIFSSQNEGWGGMANYLDTGNLDIFQHAGNTGKDHYVWDDKENKESYVPDWMLKGKKAGKNDDGLTIDQARDWLNKRSSQQAFSMYINMQNSHMPYNVPADFERKFLTDDDPEKERVLQGDFMDVKVSSVLNAYADSLLYIDSLIGELIGELKDKGLWQNTLIVVSADTATQVLSNFIGNGGDLNEDVIHVPLIIRPPPGSKKQGSGKQGSGKQAKDGQSMDPRFVQHIDVPPTIIDYMGLPAHPGFQGLSLLDESYPKSRALYMVAHSALAHQYAIIKDNRKLIYDKVENKFYIQDLVGQQGVNEALTNSLKQQLFKWIQIQLDYYKSPQQYERYYPPVIIDK